MPQQSIKVIKLSSLSGSTIMHRVHQPMIAEFLSAMISILKVSIFISKAQFSNPKQSILDRTLVKTLARTQTVVMILLRLVRSWPIAFARLTMFFDPTIEKIGN